MIKLVWLILASSIVLSACYETGNRPERVYNYEVAGQEFRFSEGYIWAYDRRTKDRVYTANFHAFLPDFSPITDLTLDERSQQGWTGGRKVTFIIKDRKEMRPLDEILEWYEKQIEGQEERHLSNGMRAYNFLKTKDIMFPEGVIALRCNKEGDKPIKYPSCNTTFLLDERIMVGASFSRKVIDDWNVFFKGLVEFLNHHRVVRNNL